MRDTFTATVEGAEFFEELHGGEPEPADRPDPADYYESPAEKRRYEHSVKGLCTDCRLARRPGWDGPCPEGGPVTCKARESAMVVYECFDDLLARAVQEDHPF